MLLRYWRYGTVGVQFAATMTLLTLGGVWLDRKFPGLQPLFTVLGALLGIAVATTVLILKVFEQERTRED